MGECDVEAVRGATARVVEHAHARVDFRKSLEPGTRVVAGAPLGEQELDFPLIELLGQHRRHGALEHRTFVQDRDQHADRRDALSLPR